MKQPLNLFLSPFAKPWAVAGESIMLPLLMIAIGIWLNPLDPLWTRASFPWAWFAPMILAMRYGPFPGLVAASLLLLAWFGFSTFGWISGDFPKQNFLGGLILVMLAGEFSSLWLARARRAESIHIYLDQRLEYLTHQYYLLRLSHDRLEQDLISRPMAMRDALNTLHGLIDSAAPSDLPGADGLLRLLAQYCQVETASLHIIRDSTIETVPTATIGKAEPGETLPIDDPLVLHAMKTGRLSHLTTLSGDTSPLSRYVIAAPLTTFNGGRCGLLAVSRLPFFALQEETLQTLNLLLGYYTDGLFRQALAAPIRGEFPHCPVDFAAEMQRLWRVRQESGVASTLVGLAFQVRPDFQNLAMNIRQQRRSLDVNWLLEDDQCLLLITLMPLAGPASAEGFIARIRDWMQKTRGMSFTEAGVFPHVLPMEELAPVPLLRNLFSNCHVSAEARTLRADL